MKKGLNKRKDARYGCPAPVEGKKGTVFEDCRAVDISKGGTGIISKSPIPVNTKMAVEIDLTPRGEPILAMGQVKWVRQMGNEASYRIGISFKDIKKSYQSRISKFFK